MYYEETVDRRTDGYVPVNTVPKESEFVVHGLGRYVTTNPYLFVRCGYVALPEGHPLYGVEYYDADFPDLGTYQPLSYSAECEGFWVLGFDCGHGWDSPDFELVPEDKREFVANNSAFQLLSGKHVWKNHEVEKELIVMAKHLAEIDEKGEY